MAVENENYKLEILEYAINQCIDSLLPKRCEDALSIILYKSNEVVWRVATDIYSKSGHQIDFSFIKDILNLRIEPLRNEIAEKETIKKAREAEEARIRAKLEAERLAKNTQKELEILTKLKNIAVKNLKLNEKLITPDYILFNWNYFGDNNDKYLDFVEFIMAIEEEFDIEIPDKEQESFWGCSFGKITNFVLQKV